MIIILFTIVYNVIIYKYDNCFIINAVEIHTNHIDVKEDKYMHEVYCIMHHFTSNRMSGSIM